jgi:hypothetical protein
MVGQMLETALGIFAVWLAWQVAQHFLTADNWLWWTLLVVAGVSYQCIFMNPSYWWMGLGIGGAAAFLGLVADLMLLAGDACKVHVLRSSRSL